jgi:hypothetical protein
MIQKLFTFSIVMNDINTMKELFEGKGTYSVYVIDLVNDVANIKKISKPAFQPMDSDFRETPLGCIYVGQTKYTPEQRLLNQIRGQRYMGRRIVQKFAQPTTYKNGEVIESPLWEEKKSFQRLDFEDSLELESWLGLKLSQEGYFVWGPHHHKENPEFLSKPPFD